MVRASVTPSLISSRDFFNVLHFDDSMLFEPQCDRARHERDGGKMLAQAIVQFLTEAALFAVTDGEDFAFQPASAVFQDGLSFFLIADVENNRDGRLGFAFGVAQWRRAHTDPQAGPIFATITFFELVWFGFPDDPVKKSLALCDVSGMCDLENGFADELALFVAQH